MSSRIEYRQLDQLTVYEINGWTHTVTLNGTLLYRGWSRKRAEQITSAVTEALDDGGDCQLNHVKAQVRKKLGSMI